MSSSSEFERRLLRHAPLAIAALGVLLLLPRLGAFGLWDPSEIKIADAARALLEPQVRPTAQPPSITVQLVSMGFRHFGVGELGGRLPLAIVSLLALLATYYLGRTVLRPRAALIGAIALATMPSFLFGGRQLTSGAPATLALPLALAGLAWMAWPPAGASRLSLLAAGLAAAAGLTLGERSTGLLVGVVAPMCAIGIALYGSTKRRAALPWLAMGGVLVAVAVFFLRKTGAYSPWLGGVPRAPQHATVVTSLLRQLGFATAPWLAFVPFAVVRALDGTQPVDQADPDRASYARLLLPGALAITYLCGTLHAATLADLVLPAAPLIALLAGAWLDEALDYSSASSSARAIEAVAIAALAIVFGHDIMLTTDAFVSVQAGEQIRWPQPLYWTGDVLFGFMAALGGLVAASLCLPLLGEVQAKTRQLFLVGAVAVQILSGFALVQWLVPVATKHLSPKDLYGKTRQLDPKAPLGQFRFNATGASYYMGGRASTQLSTLDELLTFLRKPERVFVFIGSDELGSVDQATRGTNPVGYFVIDDSNSRFLILSNHLGPGENDVNPLRRFVSDKAPSPQNALSINFDDKLQLIGYDLPAEAPAGADVRVRLYFKVLAPVGGSYKIFLHFDGPRGRVNGDHVPLDGRYPTQFWTPGTYVTDEFLLKPDAATRASGQFQLYFGFFAGDKRLKVKEGASDGENRVRLGSVRMK